jgi:hypothetical protein
MTVMATEKRNTTLKKIGDSAYLVTHATTGKTLGHVYRSGNTWRAKVAIYRWGRLTDDRLDYGTFPTRREAVAELWIMRDELATG